jgi:hypothetical protein
VHTLQRDESKLFHEFLLHWRKGHVVTVTLSERCKPRSVVGKIDRVATSGAFAVVEGLHFPMMDVRRVERSTYADKARVYPDAV